MTTQERRREQKRSAYAKLKARIVEIPCPKCGVIRQVNGAAAGKYKLPRLCRSCSRKLVRGKTAFRQRECAACHQVFSGRSGAARYCDKCAGRAPREARACPVCYRKFIGYANKTACSNPCRRRLLWNRTYFGGRLFEARGWADKTCQLCERHVPKRAHVHHVFGHPDHSQLVVLCAGCHDVVSQLARRPGFGETQFLRLRWYAMAQRLGRDPNADPLARAETA